ncbi:MAG: sle [Pseudonocardiales bacterium]|nr:sle [Pseudonocardiales bacterium]
MSGAIGPAGGPAPIAGRRLLGLENVVRPYAWGSPTAIPALLGLEPTGEPVAEMWIGAHPGAPSRIFAEGTTLLSAVAADPEALLGADVAERFGGQLPFLLKLLAAEKTLSLQTHPTVDQARAGHSAEDAEGIPPDAPHRSYQDRNHKPELLVALTEFDALCGFRPLADSARFLDRLAAAGAYELAPVRERLIANGGLRDVVTWLLTLLPADQAALVAHTVPAIRKLANGAGEWQVEAACIADLAEGYPLDVGVVLAVLLNHVRLQPGQAIFLSAGQIHAYTKGFGVELMANSDNVLRAGLTPKHINVPELLRTVDFEPAAMTPLTSAAIRAGEEAYPVPVEDFALSRVDLPEHGELEMECAGPSLVLCVAGRLTVVAGGESIALTPGGSLFASAGDPITVHGPGTGFRATTGS